MATSKKPPPTEPVPWVPISLALGIVLAMIGSAVLGNWYYAREETSTLKPKVVTGIVSPTPTPVPEYEEEIEREIIESINYRRIVVTLPEINISSNWTLLARRGLESASSYVKPDLPGRPEECSEICNFEFTDLSILKITILEVRETKDDVVEEAVDKILANAGSSGTFDCEVQSIGVGVKKINPVFFYIVLAVSSHPDCPSSLVPTNAPGKGFFIDTLAILVKFCCNEAQS